MRCKANGQGTGLRQKILKKAQRSKKSPFAGWLFFSVTAGKSAVKFYAKASEKYTRSGCFSLGESSNLPCKKADIPCAREGRMAAEPPRVYRAPWVAQGRGLSCICMLVSI